MQRVLVILVGFATAIVGAVALSFYLQHQRTAPLSKPPEHGTSFLIELSSSGMATNQLGDLESALRKRAIKIGMRYYWERVSESRARIVISSKDTSFTKMLFRPGRLEFRLVHDDSEKLIEGGLALPGYEVVQREGAQSYGNRTERLVVKVKPELSGNAVQSAMVTQNQIGQPQINFKLQPDAAATFGRVTRENVGRRLAIILDGKLYSAPYIKSPIEGGTGVIEGNFDRHEAFELATALDSPLPALTILESETF